MTGNGLSLLAIHPKREKNEGISSKKPLGYPRGFLRK